MSANNEQPVIYMTRGELQFLIESTVCSALQAANNLHQPTKTVTGIPVAADEVLLSRQDIAAKFRVSLATVGTWVKEKRLKSTKVGGRRFFRQSDVQLLFEQKGARRG